MNKIFSLIMFAIFSFQIFSLCLYCQTGDWKSYGPIFNEIPSSTINVIKEDKNGNIWFGTNNGLAKFDGVSWQIYNLSNSGIPDNNIKSIAFDSSEVIWIGTKEGGLAKFNNDSWEVFNQENSNFPSNHINVITIGPDSCVYCNFYFEGSSSIIGKFDGYQWQMISDFNNQFYLNHQLDITYINSIFFDSGNELWIAASTGLVKQNNDSWETFHFTHLDGQTVNIGKASIDENDIVWAGSSSYLIKIDGSSYNFFEGFFYGTTNDIKVLNSNNIFYVTDFGLYHFDGESICEYNTSAAIKELGVMLSIEIAADSSVWIGTLASGAMRINNSELTWFYSSEGAPCTNISEVRSQADTVWIATQNGLAKLYNGFWEYFNPANSELPSYNVNTIEIDSAGNKWIGTSNGLVIMNNNQMEIFNVANSNLINDDITSIAFGSNGEVWVGTLGGGAAYFREDTWTYIHENSCELPSNNIRDIKIDSKNNKWLCTGNGLAKFDDETWTIYNILNSDIPNNLIETIEIDSENKKWVGTSGGGLATFDDNEWVIFDESNAGLPGNYIRDIFFDPSGNAWIGYYWGCGLSKFNASNWTHFNNYDFLYGEYGLTANSLDMNKYGDLLIGSYFSGFVIFNEDEILNVDDSEIIPKGFALYQNYPNPFNAITIIPFELPESGNLQIIVFNAIGQRIGIIYDQYCLSGYHEIRFDANNLSSGIYYIMLKWGKQTRYNKVSLLK